MTARISAFTRLTQNLAMVLGDGGPTQHPDRSSDVPRVLVAYNMMPHYRWGVFNELKSSTEFQYVFASGRSEKSNSVAVIKPDQFPRDELRNHYIGPFLWQAGLLSTLVRRRPSVAIFVGDASYLTTWLGAAVMRLARVPVLFWTIGWHRPDHGLRRWVRLAFYRLADHLLLYGETAIDIGIRAGYPEHRMHRIGNSYDSSMSGQRLPVKRVAEIETQLTGLKSTVLLAVARLTEAKCLDILIAAGEMLAGRHRSATIIFAGDGPKRSELTRIATERGVDARFLGAVYDAHSLAKLYEVADVTVLPSAGGLTVIQSLTYGIPVITHSDMFHQMPEAEAVVPGVTGDLYEMGDPTSLADCIDRWIESRASREQVASACRAEVLANWSAPAQAARINAVIRQVI